MRVRDDNQLVICSVGALKLPTQVHGLSVEALCRLISLELSRWNYQTSCFFLVCRSLDTLQLSGAELRIVRNKLRSSHIRWSHQEPFCTLVPVWLPSVSLRSDQDRLARYMPYMNRLSLPVIIGLKMRNSVGPRLLIWTVVNQN